MTNNSIRRGTEIEVTLNGNKIKAFEGETVATMMMAENMVAMRTTPEGQPRGIYCGMGVCFDCLVVVDDIANTRACMTWLKSGMKIETQAGLKAGKI
jgi:aerobic-type carbon monoxide dehydrogenase small subunit (CoxS/CutS family)